LGLSFEKAGLAWVDNTYLDSDTALSVCAWALTEITQKPGTEHTFYRLGEASFHSKLFMDATLHLNKAKQLLGDDWKKLRYHNLVRLGGDVLRSGLGEYPKATLLGALLHYAEQH